MNQRTARLALALATATIMVVPGSVFAQTVMTEFTDVRYMGEEGVTLEGTVPNGDPLDPSTTYDEDDNGLTAAYAASPFQIVLNGKYINRVPGQQQQYDTDRAMLLGSFIEKGNYLTPGFGQFRAFYGAWADANGDKYLQDEFLDENRPIQITAPALTSAGYKSCTQTLSTTDQRGGFRPVGGRQGGETATNPNTQASFRCHDADEWHGISGAEIVAYVTPDSYQDYANNVFGDAAPGISPDFKYTSPGPAVNPENGSYFAPTSNFDVIITDNSFLQTTVVESIAEPKFTLSDDRLFERQTTAPLAQAFLRALRNDNTLLVGSRADVDVYRSIDPSLETAYFNNVNSALRTANVYPDDPDRSARILFVSALAAVAPTVGPTFASVVPGSLPEVTNAFTLANYQAGYHMYLDLDVKESAYTTTTQISLTSEHTETLSPGMNGKGGVAVYFSIYGVMGAWRDINTDTFIGDPAAAPGCGGDPHNCGLRPDPSSTHGGAGVGQAVVDSSEYGAAASNKEFVPRGRVHGPTVPNNGINEAMCEIAVTLTPTPNAWGPAGAYVLTDRRAAQNYASGGNTDGYETDGRSAFNPYDDIAIDLIDEVDPNPSPAPGYGGTTSAGPVIVKNFVTSGPIVIKAKSAGCGGGYSGYENVYVPGGNRGFDIHMATDVFTSTFFDVGIQTPETVYDVDCLPRWDGAPSTCGSIQN